MQAGKLPTSFGVFSPRAYPDKNPLVRLPLMYYYFASLRSTHLPADATDLLAHRGQGQTALVVTGFTGRGATALFAGLPVIYEPCWDFGGAAIGSLWRFEYLLPPTQGILSDPRASPSDNNGGLQLAACLGLSVARGPY